MMALTCPACAAHVKRDDLICFTCGANLRRRGPDEDPPAPATVMQEYMRHEETTGSISAAVLRLAFPTGNVEVPAGTSLLLGRDPAESLVAAAFAEFDNVSRRHATVTVDDSGHATIRLGGAVSAEVLLPRQEPDPASLSRESRQNGQVGPA